MLLPYLSFGTAQRSNRSRVRVTLSSDRPGIPLSVFRRAGATTCVCADAAPNERARTPCRNASGKVSIQHREGHVKILCHEPHKLKPGGLSLARRRYRLRDVWLHDGSPAKHTNVLGSDCIGMTSAATRYTAEGGLTGAVRLVDMTAYRTCAARVSWIDQHNGDAGSLRFVGD